MLSINVWFQVCVDIGLPEMLLQMRLGGLKEKKLFGSSLLKPRCLSYPRQKRISRGMDRRVVEVAKRNRKIPRD